MEVEQSIRVDRAHKLIEVRIGGFVTPEDASWLGEQVREAVRSFGDDIGQHLTLYDTSDVPVVPPATIELLQQTFANPTVRQIWARKIAFVVGTALTRLQAQRLREVRPDIGIFDDRKSAIDWLLN
ncbi:hypothetical protein [Sphingomonas soli]|uniref:hypothetical protein n=1 Tax=Sphingomonas soli TaxID=266127 RepID=UPI00082FC6E2|nr:hypothetical protein [Sphingomonas soli]